MKGSSCFAASIFLCCAVQTMTSSLPSNSLDAKMTTSSSSPPAPPQSGGKKAVEGGPPGAEDTERTFFTHNDEKNILEAASSAVDADVVADSSRLIAAARAIESQRDQPLFHDPYAAKLAGEAAMTIRFEPANSTSIISAMKAKYGKRLAVRTRFFDDMVEDASLNKGIKQFVLVGAGMDTRALRCCFASPADTKVYEVDKPSVLNLKRRILSQFEDVNVTVQLGNTNAKEANRGIDEGDGEGEGGTTQSSLLPWGWRRKSALATSAISTTPSTSTPTSSVGPCIIPCCADLQTADLSTVLTEAGFDPKLPTCWVLEGLLMYLSEEDVKDLIYKIANLSAEGSLLGASTVSADSVVRAKESLLALMKTWKWGVDEPAPFFLGVLGADWGVSCVQCGAPGGYPSGADYGVGYEGTGPFYAVCKKGGRDGETVRR